MKITKLEKQMGDFHLNIAEMNLEPGLIHGLVGANG